MDKRQELGLLILTALREYCIDQKKYYSCDNCIFSKGNSCIVSIPSEHVLLDLKNKLVK